jgi:hypothetical protein
MFESSNIPQEEVPKDLKRKFSKELAPELRDRTAQRIREIRRLKTSSKELKESELFEDYRAQEIYEKLHESIFDRVFDRQYLKDLEARLAEVAGEKKEDLIKKTQEQFEAELAKVLEESPLTPEEQEKYLSEEAMSAMNLEDYLILLQRLSGNFVTHVTRQGVREQSFMYHSQGLGEFTNSFVDVLRSGKLQSMLSSSESGPVSFTDKWLLQMIGYYQDEKGMSEEDVVEQIWDNMLKSEFTDRGANMPADKSSVHFAANDILSGLYGAERNYDIYFYYPSEFIAYNYNHYRRNGPGFDSTLGEDQQYNDIGVWNEGRGMPIDAGLVCIPEDVPVNPETGSQYELGADKKPSPNPEMVKHLEWIKQNESEAINLVKELQELKKKEKGHAVPDNARELGTRLGFTSDEVFKQFWDSEVYYGNLPETTVRWAYEKTNNSLLRSREIVSSKDYWNSFFDKNPEMRPSKVLFYERNRKFVTHGVSEKSNPYKDLSGKGRFTKVGDLPNYDDYLKKAEQITKNRVRSLMRSQEQLAA